MGWLVATIAIVSGCGGDGSGGAADAGAGDAAADSGFEPTPPSPPSFLPCPAGWREVADPDDPDLVTCDPWPKAGPADCAVDEAHFPGEPGCRPVGTDCPAGDFSVDLPAGATVWFVRPGAVGGDGSEAAPFGTIAAAIGAADDDAVIALAKGTYDEVVDVGRPLTLLGACVAETVLASSSPSTSAATLTLRSRGGGRVENLTVSGERIGIDVVGCPSPWEIHSVVVRDAVADGIRHHGPGDLVATDLVVRDTRATVSRQFGIGMDLWAGARADVTRAVFSGNHATGVMVEEGATTLVLRDVAIRETRSPDGSAELGHGLEVFGGARCEVERAVVTGNDSVSVLASEPESEILLTDAVLGDAVGDTGYGLESYDGARIVASRTFLRRSRGAAIVSYGAGSEMDVFDVVVQGTQARTDGDGGYGIELGAGTHAEVARAVFDHNRGVAIVAAAADTDLVATDVVVRDTVARTADGDMGDGFQIHDGARATIQRARIERCRRFGLLALVSAVMTLSDVEVRETLVTDCSVTGDCTGFGTGIGVADGATVTANRFRCSDNALCGVQLVTGGEADLSTGVISGNPIGANVQTETFDLARLQDDVVYSDNGTALDSTALPVPGAIEDVR